MKEKRFRPNRTVIVFIVILLSYFSGGMVIEMKLFSQFNELSVTLLMLMNCIVGYLYWKKLATGWLTKLWLLIYSITIIAFIGYSIGYHWWGWASPYKKHLLQQPLSPVLFVVLYLIHKIGKRSQNKTIYNILT